MSDDYGSRRSLDERYASFLARCIAELMPVALDLHLPGASSVLATRCVVDLAERFFIEAAPIGVECFVGDEAVYDLIAHGGPTENAELLGATLLARGEGHDPTGLLANPDWNGKLVARVGSNDLVDCATPRLPGVPRTAVVGFPSSEKLEQWIDQGSGSMLRLEDAPLVLAYIAAPDLIDWNASTDWTGTRHVPVCDLLEPQIHRVLHKAWSL
jgi:hypothetical protein